jgi:hypothetical protein
MPENEITKGLYEIYEHCKTNIMIGRRLIASIAGFSDSRDSARHHAMNEANAEHIVKCVNSFQAKDPEKEALIAIIKTMRVMIRHLIKDFDTSPYAAEIEAALKSARGE